MIELLRHLDIRALADIRSYPHSRHNPQFNLELLERELPAHGIRYGWLRDLGGRRRLADRTSRTNAAWRSDAFRAYADYMQTPAFERGLEQLRAFAAWEPTAILCSEAVPWRCHRSLVADALIARGAEVQQVIGDRVQPHRLTPFAHVEAGHVTYPA